MLEVSAWSPRPPARKAKQEALIADWPADIIKYRFQHTAVTHLQSFTASYHIYTMEVDTGTVNLVSKEGDTFPVDIEVARMSELVKGMLEEGKISSRPSMLRWKMGCFTTVQ